MRTQDSNDSAPTTSGGDGEPRSSARAGAGKIYRHASGGAPVAPDEALASVAGSSGAALPDGPRARMEESLGHDLSAVRVHTGAASAGAATQLQARAFTTGQDIHFGAGEYRPDDPYGMHLLAHEVAHTVQQRGGDAAPQRKAEVSQPGDAAEVAADRFADHVVHGAPMPSLGAASGVIQRAPVAPTYGGQTGVRDLSKITIEPISDFVASTLTASRPIHAYPNDPAIKHFTWMLYDPTGNMVGGFSTLPGRPTALTAPFDLEPRYFQAGQFTPGKFILRCSGLDDQHRPLYYADRDFQVMVADQTTGTAAATGAGGSINFTRYDKHDGTPQNPQHSVDVAIAFTPDATAGIQDAAFIQMVQLLDARGRSEQQTIHADQAARQTPLAWSIDRVAGAPAPFYIEGNVTRVVNGRPVTTQQDIPAWGQAGRSNGAGQPSTPATLLDTPAWNQEERFKAESVVICRSGPDRGRVYGACTWGYTATAAGAVTLMPRSVHAVPSDEFVEAKTMWNTWRATKPVASRPDAAP